MLPEAVETYKAGWPAYSADIEAMTVYATSVKEGTEDAANWTVSPNPATEGQKVTINYAGTKSVKSVTAKKKTTTGNITVYFSDALNWGDVHVYYWNNGPAWPGTPMTYVKTNEYSQKIYKAVIPATAVGIVFNNNSNRQTANIKENIADGSWWYTTDQYDGTKNEVGYVGKWYEVKNVDDNKWTFTMPDGDMELDIEYNVAYPVTISDGDVDAANWSAPTEQSVGQNVTLQYTGKKKIKRITIVAATAPDPTPTLSLTSPAVGQVIGSDGKNYAADATLPTGVTKVAIIAHLNGSNGLAIALADESGTMNLETAKSTCAAKTPAFTGGTWKLPTKDEWTAMFKAFGDNDASYSGLNTAITTAGGTALQDLGIYWSSTPDGEDRAWAVGLAEGSAYWGNGSVDVNNLIRACLAFGGEADPTPAATDLSTLADDYEAQDGEVLTGTLASKVKISIADGATVTLKDVNITNLDYSCDWPGINCPGDATLVLEGTNEVCAGIDDTGEFSNYPAIYIAPGQTLTIQGAGTLTAYSNAYEPYGAGIGGGYDIACGHIVINSGNIKASGGYYAAGIGSGGYGGYCGDITINGGNIMATGGDCAAGIGSGRESGSCGTITIKSTVTSVTATKGDGSPNSIGAGQDSPAITVNIEAGANVTQN